MRPSSAHRAVSTDTTCISLMPTMMTGRIRSSSGRCRSEKGKSIGKCLCSLADRIRHKKPRRETKGKLSVSRRGIYVRCRLVCVVKNCFSRRDPLQNPPMVFFAAIGRKCLRILGRTFLLSQIPVSARHVCLNHCFRSLLSIYSSNLCFCFKTLLRISALSKLPELPVCDIDDNIHSTVNPENTCVDHKIMSVA